MEEKNNKKDLIWKIIIPILAVLGGMFLLYQLFCAILLAVLGLEFVFNKGDEISGIENYNKNFYVKEYSGDLDSNLSIFPNDTSNMIDANFKSYFKVSLFDTDGYIVLDTKYDKENFENEIERLKNIKVKIKFQDDEVINKILFDNEQYNYDAYIANDGFGSTYEYALIDETNYHIVYIYFAYYDLKYDIEKDYLKKDMKEYFDYSKTTLNEYTIYNHTFDNGESYIEYDDYYNVEE